MRLELHRGRSWVVTVVADVAQQLQRRLVRPEHVLSTTEVEGGARRADVLRISHDLAVEVVAAVSGDPTFLRAGVP